jgi:RHH-type proline utilization regulon transcriptional repressor/proline dehydrogenase/delta 1-pyrroline-5-carboxylate dehydrogenase
LRADDLDHAIELQNGTDFGLTGGIQSLDPAEIGHWLDGVEVGNAYVNRHITGAIVRRQPFGGWKRSSVGRGAKSGGPDDILRFIRPVVGGPPVDTTASYLSWWHEQFGTERDDAGLACEANVLRYRGVRGVVVRTTAATTTGELSLLRRAAALTGVPMSVSAPPETDADLAARIADSGVERLRTLGPVDDALATACHRAGVAIDDTPVTGHGRLELPCWLREQSVSQTMHRHGRLQPRQAI